MREVRVTFGRINPIVGPKYDGIEQAGSNHNHSTHNHSIGCDYHGSCGVRGQTILMIAMDTISERCQVDRPRPDA